MLPRAGRCTILLCLAHTGCSLSGLSVAPNIQQQQHGNHQGGRSVGHKKKVRHHVNPLKSIHQQPLILPEDWPKQHFTHPSQPLHVDVGCARGVFCLDYAAQAPALNVLGLEIRSVLAEAASEDARQLALGNAAFLACNANTNLEQVLRLAAPCAPLRSVSIQFPDPWFKTRHHKRRVVQPELVRTIGEYLAPGGWLFFQSDVLDLSESARLTMREASEAAGLRDAREDAADWDVPKPESLLGVCTERERASEALGRPVYRSCFYKV